MPSSIDLTLLIPGLLDPPQGLDPGRFEAPWLARALARADRSLAPGNDPFSSLFALFGYPRPAAGELPEGAVAALGEGLTCGADYWLRADPVHLYPDRDRLLLFPAGQLEITRDEADGLVAQFNDHFAGDGLRLHAPRPGRWYLRVAGRPCLTTQPLHRVAGRHIESFMPQGEDARPWRQRLNEMQMLLFQAPANQQREAAGRPTVNGIWLSGGGPLPAPADGPFARIFGDDPALRGLARLQGLRTEALPLQPAGLPGGRAIGILDRLWEPVVDGDTEAWITRLAELEGWLQALFEAMGPTDRLSIYPGNGHSFTLTRAAMRRFWRRDIDLLLSTRHPS